MSLFTVCSVLRTILSAQNIQQLKLRGQKCHLTQTNGVSPKALTFTKLNDRNKMSRSSFCFVIFLIFWLLKQTHKDTLSSYLPYNKCWMVSIFGLCPVLPIGSSCSRAFFHLSFNFHLPQMNCVRYVTRLMKKIFDHPDLMWKKTWSFT